MDDFEKRLAQLRRRRPKTAKGQARLQDDYDAIINDIQAALNDTEAQLESLNRRELQD